MRTKGKNKGIKGYGLPRVNGGFRWCTSQLKQDPAKKYLNKKYGANNYIQYIGFAFDEQKRMRTDLYPLVYWGVTEQDALEGCYKAGFTWDGLYDHFDRVSCWLCPFKSKEEKEILRKHFPELSKRIYEMECRTYEIEGQLKKNAIA